MFQGRESGRSNTLDTDPEHTGRLLMTQLTTARWCLDRVPTVGPEASRRQIQRARDIYEEVARSLAMLRAGPESFSQVQRALEELRARLRAIKEP